ncbi:MAG: hypothetical protein P1V36_14375 [Planctomycetota bacterium]|nr:hypothetical protein [Planctomycetota bacterium]
MDRPLQFRIDPQRVALALAAVAFVLVLLNIGSAWLWADDGLDLVSYKYVNMFDLDEEESFGTWFSAAILLLAGQLTLLVARSSKRTGDGLWVWWFVLGLGFHYLSIDEVAGMHEFLNTYGEELLGISERWTTYALVGVVLLTVAYVPFLQALRRQGRTRTLALLILSGGLYVGGAVGAEWLSPSDPAAFSRVAYAVGWVSLEEGLEMAGVILVIYGLLDALRGEPTNTLRAELGTHARPDPVEADGKRASSRPPESARPRAPELTGSLRQGV